MSALLSLAKKNLRPPQDFSFDFSLLFAVYLVMVVVYVGVFLLYLHKCKAFRFSTEYFGRPFRNGVPNL